MNNNQCPTIEWAPFEIAEHVTEEMLLNAADVLEQEFLLRQPGYISRELLKKDARHWVDLVYWRSPQDAAFAAKAANESEFCYQYFSLMVGVENAESGISHLTQMKVWQNNKA